MLTNPRCPPGLATDLHTAGLRETIVQRLAQFDARSIALGERRHAAVVLPLVEAGHGLNEMGIRPHAQWSQAPALLITRRAGGLKRHAGQWALPGGRLDPGESAEQAALRELHEEVGLRVEPSALMGRLDDYATRSGFVITPWVAWVGAAQEARPQAGEVASLHRLHLTELLRADAPILEQHEGHPHPALKMPVGHGWIAAPTAAFLYQFRELCLLGEPTRVAHLDQPRFAWQ